MKKNLKKGLVLGLVSVMSLSMLSGCGTKKEVNKEDNKKNKDDKATVSEVDIELNELLSEAAISIADIETIKLGMAGDVKLKMVSEEMDMDIAGDVNLEGIVAVDEPKFNLNGALKYELEMSGTKLSGDYTLESYAETVNDKMSVYARINDEDWTSEEGDVAEYMEEVQYLKENIEELSTIIEEADFSVLDEYKDYIRLEDKTQVVDGVECYVISANLNMEQITELYETYDDTGSMEEDFENVKDFTIDCSLFFDKSNCVPVKFAVDMAISTIDGTMDIENLGFEVSLGINTGDEIKDVPEEVKENASDMDVNTSDLFEY